MPTKLPPWLLLIVTLVAFGGAFAAYGLKPWGPVASAALMIAWLALMVATAVRQNREDRRAGRVVDAPQIRLSPLARIVGGALGLSALACFAYAQWLDHQGAALDVTRPWTDGAILLMALSWPGGWLVDAAPRWASWLWTQSRR